MPIMLQRPTSFLLLSTIVVVLSTSASSMKLNSSRSGYDNYRPHHPSYANSNEIFPNEQSSPYVSEPIDKSTFSYYSPKPDQPQYQTSTSISLSPVHEEDPESLSDAISNTRFTNGWLIVMFYNPDCPHCKHLMPIYEDYAQERQQNQSSDVFVKLDGMKYQETLLKYGIDMFPGVQMYNSGEKFGDTMPIGFSQTSDLFRTYVTMQMRMSGLAKKFGGGTQKSQTGQHLGGGGMGEGFGGGILDGGKSESGGGGDGYDPSDWGAGGFSVDDLGKGD
jgi:thiol-disulfide isomerase/thioredoxin